MRKRAALSEVISSVILAGVVLSIGGALWGYSLGASGNMANSYANNVIDNMNTVTERFIVEHVYASASGDELTVLVYNYGETPISVDVTAIVNIDETTQANANSVNDIGKDSYEEFILQLEVDAQPYQLAEGDEVSITVASGRGNNVYYTYFVK